MFDFCFLARAMMREAIGGEKTSVMFQASPHGTLTPVTLTYERDDEGWEFFTIDDGFGGEEVYNNRAIAETALADAIREWLDIYIADGVFDNESADALKRETLVKYAGVVWTPPTA